MTDDGGISQPLILVGCVLVYIIVSCVLTWLTCFITAARKGEKAYDLSISLLWPIFIIMAPFAVVVALWLLLRGFLLKHRIPRTAVDILTLPFRPTELGMRLYKWRRNKKSTKLKKEGNDE